MHFIAMCMNISGNICHLMPFHEIDHYPQFPVYPNVLAVILEISRKNVNKYFHLYWYAQQYWLLFIFIFMAIFWIGETKTKLLPPI